jgi:hypothetical protein
MAILGLLEDLDAHLQAEGLGQMVAGKAELRARVRLAADELRDTFGKSREYQPRPEDLGMLGDILRTIAAGGSAIVFADGLDQQEWLEAMLSMAGHGGKAQYVVNAGSAGGEE